ncbi:MAG: GerMN domain-containing protein [Bacillota bacterium]|jgi:hypothetical protein
MKKFIILATCFIAVFLLFGCTVDDDSIIGSLNDYFPIQENVRYVYEGEGNEYASYSVWNDYTDKYRLQQRIETGGTVMAQVIYISDHKISKILSREEIYHRENLLAETNQEELLLIGPLKVGTSWTLSDGRVRTITGIAADVSTPSGDYKALEITTKGPEDKTLEYYAKDIGLVKSVFISGDTQISSTLSKIEKDTELLQQINFYYPNIEDGKFYFIAKNISFHTNDDTKTILAEAYKDLPAGDNLGQVFTSKTVINSLTRNQEGIVRIDLNKAFIKDMNAGALYEQMILQSIANTFGQYYNVEKVILTIDGQPYQSGHISMQEGQYLTVDCTNLMQIE